MIFKIRFYSSNNKLYELYAKSVYQSDMYGFMVVEDIVFGEQSEVIVDPSEDQLEAEFKNTARLYVPLHNIVLLEEVRKKGKAKIHSGDRNNRDLVLYPKMPKDEGS